MAGEQSFDTTLRCLALPVTKSDIGKPLQEVLSLWSDPRFAPVLSDGTIRPHLLLVVNDATDEILAKARGMFDAHPELRQSFGEFTARSADLKRDMDRYERKPRGRIGTFGARAGPNFQFFRTMEMAREFGGFTLQIELDCLPVQAGWIEAAQAVIDGNASAWVIGSVYSGNGELTRASQGHMNGNALYRAGDDLFQSFLAEVWLPRLLHFIKDDHTLPYDCWWALECDKASADRANESWQLFQTFGSFMQSDPFVVNLLCKPSDAQQYAEVLERFAQLGRMPVFLHGSAMTSLRSRLLENPQDTLLHSIDRLTGERGTRLRRTEWAAKTTPIGAAPRSRWIDRIGVGETALRAAAAEMLATGAHSGAAQTVERCREVLGDTSATVRYFDRIAAFTGTRIDA